METASSGPEGLNRLVHEKFDCVLVDLVMPGMDGIEVCRQIAADSEPELRHSRHHADRREQQRET